MPAYLKYLVDTYLINTHELTAVLVELLVIAFVVYSVMRFLQGTGGERLFKGIVFVLLGVLIVKMIADTLQLRLERIELLFNYLFLGVVIVAVVAFQPELRRGLMQLGGARLGKTAVPEMAHVVEQIVEATSALSRKQIGAIIALEREVALGDFVATGTRLDAQVSARLLQTIFWPGSPLHDMGVIIRRNRLAAAGVQFPLAEHGEYDRTLGSRHRAAIGLSKATDALVVIVSEETGQIALAADGKLARLLTVEQLHRQLLDLMISLADRKTKSGSSASGETKSTVAGGRPSSTSSNLSAKEDA